MAGDRRIARPDSALPDSISPDAAYRPVPIVWFAASFMLQMVVLMILLVLLLDISGHVTILASGLATGAIAMWTWERGMKQAAPGWRIATATMLASQLALVCIAASFRP